MQVHEATYPPWRLSLHLRKQQHILKCLQNHEQLRWPIIYRLRFLLWNSETAMDIQRGPEFHRMLQLTTDREGYMETLTNVGWWRCPERRRRNRLTVNKQNVHAVQCEMQRRQIWINQSARLCCHSTKQRRKFLSKILNFAFNLVLIPYWNVPNQYSHLRRWSSRTPHRAE